MGVQGGLHPVTVEGGDIGEAIYLQDTTPEDPNGIWINTDKTYDNIYIENERYATDGSILFSNADTTDPSNPIANHTNNGLSLLGATYAQKGNIVHFFGFYSTSSSANTTTLVHRHWKYDFDTNTWTQLSDCPTPQGGVSAVWVGNYIYIFGTAYNVNSDYNLYSYKYDTINDTWERIADLPAKPSQVSSYGIGCVYDNDNYIYISSTSNYFYRYDISTNTYTSLTAPSYAGYNHIVYYNGYIYTVELVSTGYSSYAKRYTPSTNSWVNYSSVTIQTYTGGDSGQSYDYMPTVILTNNRLYVFSSSNNAGYNFVSGSLAPMNANYGWISLDSPSTYKKITTKNTFSNARGIAYVPVCDFTTDTGNIILFFGGISSGMTAATNNQMGTVVQDKDYSNLTNNTLIIYSTDGTMGTYTTPIYQNEKVVNGKIYQKFNDVNLWDAENQTLIKNLHTYYGNGTDWVQIK